MDGHFYTSLSTENTFVHSVNTAIVSALSLWIAPMYNISKYGRFFLGIQL